MVFAFAGDSTTTNAFAMTGPTLPEFSKPDFLGASICRG
jgi:hypothetical protein